MAIFSNMLGALALLGLIVPPAAPQARQVRKPASAPTTCDAHFEGELVLIVQPDGRLMRLNQPYAFRDGKCGRWSVPKGALVDGASIPGALWSVIGGPFEGRYRNASVLHDWYCITRTRPWREVHRMFFDGMIAAGVPRAQAQLMYAAVYLRGPRWDQMTVANARLAYAIPDGSKGIFSTPALRAALEQGKVDPKTKLQDVPRLTESEVDALSSALEGKVLDADAIERVADAVDKG